MDSMKQLRHLISLVIAVFLFPLVVRAQTSEDCLACHSDPTLTMERKGKSVSLFVDETVLSRSVHKKLVCVACHTGFNAEEIPHKEKIEPVNCLTCHKATPFKHAFHPQMIRASGVSERPDVSCKHCHGTHNVISPKDPGSRFHSSNLIQSCGECHTSVKEHFLQCEHGKALQAGVKSAPNCLTCHRRDITQVHAGRDSTQLKIVQEKVCLSCHLDDPQVRARTSPSAGFIAAYEQSVHGAALLRGNGRAANCVDCHGSHDMKKALDPSALVHQTRLAETCGKCHGDVAKEFEESIHGVAVRKGNKDAPTCTTCHGEHNILAPTDPRSPVAPLNVSGQVCSPCHSSVKLSQKYGISADRFQTFSDSYHGLAIRAGAVEVANCASCHGVHNIKPSTDPTSTIHKANLAATCGKCHPGANENFAVGTVHVVATAESEPVLYWIANVYVVLIVVIVGGMFFHNLIDFIKKAKLRIATREGRVRPEVYGPSLYLRMTVSERLQHGALLVSFFVLVITGFMLRFPDAWWVVLIRTLSPDMFEIRSVAHRVAGVVMIAASLYHLYYILFVPRGKQLIRDLLPRLQDLRDARDAVLYNLGISSTRPKFGRFGYVEKAEYWALVWGTVVMVTTGVIMWFENTFVGLLTKLGWDIARTIHYYEAWLATLAILVWHIYYVIFNPNVYPMNMAWITGTLTEAEMAEEHPLELEQIKAKELQEDITEAKEEPLELIHAEQPNEEQRPEQ